MTAVAAPLTWTDQFGDPWHVWDVVDGQRVPVGVVDASTRLYVRVSDRWAFTHTPNPRARPWPADPMSLRWGLRCALEGDPLRRPGDADDAHAARVQAHTAAHRAAVQAQLQRSWDPATWRRCPGPCPTCDDDRRRGAPAHPNPD